MDKLFSSCIATYSFSLPHNHTPANINRNSIAFHASVEPVHIYLAQLFRSRQRAPVAQLVKSGHQPKHQSLQQIIPVPKAKMNAAVSQTPEAYLTRLV